MKRLTKIPIRKLLDWTGAAIISCFWFAISGTALLNREDFVDWIAYALPSANWVTSGLFALPQLGTQHSFNQFWLFSSPLMGLGPWPWFKLFGVARESYLFGIMAIYSVNLVVFSVAFHKLLRIRSFTFSCLLVYTVLGNRIYMSSLYNQRYDLLVYSGLLLAFYPKSKPARWQWLIAGGLTLLHPSLLIASVIWLVWPLLRSIKKGPLIRALGFDWIYYALSLLFVFFWYGRWSKVQAQMLPYINSYASAMQTKSAFMLGLFPFPLEYLGGLSSAIFLLGCAVSAVAIVCFMLVSKSGRQFLFKNESIFSGALAISVGLIIDTFKGFSYNDYLMISLAPIIIAFGSKFVGKKLIFYSLLILALSNLYSTQKLDFLPPSYVKQKDIIDFVVKHTHPGDRIVLASPFVLAAPPHVLPENRKVVYVIPQPFCLEDFDFQLFRKQIRQETAVYLGAPEWYEEVVSQCTPFVKVSKEKLFESAHQETTLFGNQVVIVARKNYQSWFAPPPPEFPPPPEKSLSSLLRSPIGSLGGPPPRPPNPGPSRGVPPRLLR